MKKVLTLLLTAIIALSAIDGAFAEESFYISLDGEWDFYYYSSYEELYANEPAEALKITVPGAMEMQGYGYPGYYFEEQGYWGMPDDDGVHNIGVYSKTFVSDSDRETFLVFDSVKDALTVYINDEEVGQSDNAEIGCAFSVSLKKGVNSVTAVVARDNSGVNKADNFALSGLTGSVYLTDSFSYAESVSHDVKIEDNVLYIDGVKTVLRGVKYTPTYPTGGDVIGAEQIEKDLSIIKEYGFNAVWTSSAPDAFYEKAEEKGLYVIDEANIYLPNADNSAAERASEMVKRHRKYRSIIMWSAGSGASGRADRAIIEAIEKADARPVVQNMNAFAPEKEVFGNTGGFDTWVNSLGNGNIGGFIKEFADKELYTTRQMYEFSVKDAATGKSVDIEGEIKNINGSPMLGSAEFKAETKELDRFTVLGYVSDPDGDRVIFESEDGSVKLEVRWGRACMTINGQSADCALEEGLIAIVYADGEAQLFAGHSFKANFRTDAHIGGSFLVGDGDTAIKYIKVYDDALSLDELLTVAEANTVNSIAFDDIDIKKDNSYEYLAYGGDFGDSTNSYYKSIKGLFTSLREPHPEAEEVKALFEGKRDNAPTFELPKTESGKAKAEMKDGKAVLTSEGTKVAINRSGAVESFVQNGVEQLAKPFSVCISRGKTLAEYENEDYSEEIWFDTKEFKIKDNMLHVELVSRDDARLNIFYTLTEDGALHVSVQSQFGNEAEKPTFIGFKGKTGYTHAAWYGKKQSTYPDRRNAGEYGEFEADVNDLADNYAVPQENGNRTAYRYVLSGDNGSLTFASAEGLEITALPYSFEAMEYEDHDEDLEYENASYIRVGGYIAGVDGDEKYKLNNSMYGFSFSMTSGNLCETKNDVTAVYIDGERFTDFAPDIKTYVYRTNSVPEISIKGDAELICNSDFCTFGDYTVYFAEADSYLTELEKKSAKGEIEELESVTLMGDRFRGESDKVYVSALAMKSGSEITYDVSDFDSNVFSAVIGKDASSMSMVRGFNRAMFDAQASVEIYLDGKLALEERGISMFSGKRNISVDVSAAKELKIVVTGSGNEETAQFENAVLADAKIEPKGPIVLAFERNGSDVSITVLNTDSDEIFVTLSAMESESVTTTATSITKGLYRTLTLHDVSEEVLVKAVVSGLGREEAWYCKG